MMPHETTVLVVVTDQIPSTHDLSTIGLRVPLTLAQHNAWLMNKELRCWQESRPKSRSRINPHI